MSLIVRCEAILLVVIWLAVSSGCGRGGRAMQMGTEGTIRLQGVAVADLQVNVFADDGSMPRRVAYGVFNIQGEFRLISDDGKGPAILKPGRYRLTVESVAAETIPVPPAVGDVTTTTLTKEWLATDNKLVVEVI